MAAFTGYREFYRWVATIGITEEGMFKEDEIPDDVVSSVLYVETVYRIVLVDASGQLTYMDFDNPPAMDKERNPGGPVILDGAEEPLYTEDGSGAATLTLSRRESSRLPDAWRSRAKQMEAIAESEGVMDDDINT